MGQELPNRRAFLLNLLVEIAKTPDENLAPELLAEERQVWPDDWTEIEQYRCRSRRKTRQEPVQRFGGERRLVGRRHRSGLVVRGASLSQKGEEIGERAGRSVACTIP